MHVLLSVFVRASHERKSIPQVRKQYTSNPDFTPANAAKASSAAEGLCKWLHAMDAYERISRLVAPKRAALLEAETEYNAVKTGLESKQAALDVLLGKLQAMQDRLDASLMVRGLTLLHEDAFSHLAAQVVQVHAHD